MATTFTLDKQKHTINITYGFAVVKLREEYNLDIINLFEENNLEQLVMKVTLNDDLCLRLIAHFSDNDVDPIKESKAYEAFLDKITPEVMEEFRQALWVELDRFFGPTKSSILKAVRFELPKVLKKQMVKMLENLDTLEEPSSATLEKQE